MARKAKDINIYFIAEKAGTSAGTVSRVINRRSGVGEATRKKITDLLQQYNFMPNYPSLKTPKVAVIYPWASLSEYFRRIMEGIYSYSIPNKLTTSIIIAHAGIKESLLESLREHQCTAAIALLPEHYYKELDIIAETDIPIVAIDSSPMNKKIGFINNDSYSGVSEAVRHLVDLGHKKIGYITYNYMSMDQIQRLKGFENTLNALGVSLDPACIARPGNNGKPDMGDNSGKASYMPSRIRGETGYNAMRQLLNQAPHITAVVAADDAMALGAIAAIAEVGLRIPEDISVIGFDNYPETKFWQPPLTTVNHPVEKAGYMAIEAIHQGLSNPLTRMLPQEILSTNLVIRKSTGLAKT